MFGKRLLQIVSVYVEKYFDAVCFVFFILYKYVSFEL